MRFHNVDVYTYIHGMCCCCCYCWNIYLCLLISSIDKYFCIQHVCMYASIYLLTSIGQFLYFIVFQSLLIYLFIYYFSLFLYSFVAGLSRAIETCFDKFNVLFFRL